MMAVISVLLSIAIVFAGMPVVWAETAGIQRAPFAGQATEKTVSGIEVVASRPQLIEHVNGDWDTRWNEETQENEPYFCYSLYQTDLTLTVHYKDGTTAVYSNYNWSETGYPLNIDDNQYDAPWGIGTHTVTAEFMGKTTTFEVEVVENSVSGIEVITSRPQLTEHAYGGWNTRRNEETQEDEPYFHYALYQSDLTLTVHYKDGTTAVYADDEWEETGYSLHVDDGQYDSPWGIGKHMVNVTYMGKTAAFEVEIIENPVSSIEVVTSRPQMTEHSEGYWDTRRNDETQEEEPYFRYSLHGEDLTLTVYYKDGTTAVYVDYEWQDTGYNIYIDDDQYDAPWGLGTHTATVQFMGKTAAFEVEIIENPVSSIEVTTSCSRFVEHTDGSWDNRWVFETWEYEPYFRYSIYHSDLTLTVHYKDGSTAVYSNYEWEETGYSLYVEDGQYDSPWGIGTHTVDVRFMGGTAAFEVEVVENPVAGIEVATLRPRFIEHETGHWNTRWDDELYFCYSVYQDDLILTVRYKDGTTAVYSNFEWEEIGYLSIDDGQFDAPWGLGTHTVSVEFMGFTDTFEVEVVKNPVSRIEVSTTQPRLAENVDGYWNMWWNDETENYELFFEYLIGYDTILLTVYYEDGTSEVFTGEEWMNAGYRIYITDDQYDAPWGLGKHTVTVESAGKTASFEVEVVKNDITGISLLSPPDKTRYIAGAEYFDPEGLQIFVTHRDGSSSQVDYLDYGLYIPYDDIVMGKNTVEILYGGYSLQIEIEGISFLALFSSYKTLTAGQASAADIEESLPYDIFSFVPAVSGEYHIYSNTYRDTCVYLLNSAGEIIEQDDDGGSSWNFSMTRWFVAGRQYYVVVGYYDGSTGCFDVFAEYNASAVFRGDANDDGKIDVADIVEVRDHILGKKRLTGNAADAADVNNSGDIDVEDIVAIRDHILGKTLLF